MKIYFNVCPIVLLLLMIGTSACKQKRTVNAENSEQMLTQANTLYYNRDFKSVILLFDMLIEKDSLNGELYFNRGYSKSQMDDFESAKKDYRKSIILNYRIKDAYLNLGILECITNDSLAIIYFNNVLNIDSTNVKAKAYRKQAIKRLNLLHNKVI